MYKTHFLPGRIALCLLLALLLIDGWLITLAASATKDSFRVSFLDVGQGDAALIETPTGTQVLIDGGAAGTVSRPLSRELPFYDRSLDMVIATHADGDHVGGLVTVLKEYEVEHIIMPARASDSSAYQAFRKAAQAEKRSGATFSTLTAGEVLDLGGSAYLLALFPASGRAPAGTNDSSLVLKLVYGETSWLFSGDSPQAIERFLSHRYGRLLDADVLKVGHHGSDTSSALMFLSAVSPQTAIISAGADNSYGHPHQSVLERLASVEAEVICTCEVGTITFESDGRSIIQLR